MLKNSSKKLSCLWDKLLLLLLGKPVVMVGRAPVVSRVVVLLMLRSSVSSRLRSFSKLSSWLRGK